MTIWLGGRKFHLAFGASDEGSAGEVAGAPGVTLLRMEGVGQMVDPHSGRLHGWVEAAAAHVYEALALEPVR